MPPGEETVERSMAELLPPERVPPARIWAGWLRRWMTLAGIMATALAAAALALCLLAGARPVPWKGSLLAFECAAVALIARSLLGAGTSAGTPYHRAFAAAGLAAGGLTILGAVLRALAGFIHGTPLPDLATGLLAFGLPGAVLGVVFWRCLQERRWACRAAAVSSAAFLLLLASQPFVGYGILASGPVRMLRPLQGQWAAQVAVGFAAVGLLLSWDGARQPASNRRPLRALALVWFVLLLATTGFVAGHLAHSRGMADAAGVLWRSSALWAAAALTPLLLIGLVQAWRRRATLQADAQATARFAYAVAALFGVACLVVWLPLQFHWGRLDGTSGGIIAAGLLCAVMLAWLTATQGDWVSRWALVPAAALALGALCALGGLLWLAAAMAARAPGSPGSDAGQADLWRLAAAFLWSVLAVVAVLAVGGLAARWHRHRLGRPVEALQTDVRLLAAGAWSVCGLLLCALFALAAGEPAVADSIRHTFGRIGSLLTDLLTLGAGPPERWPAIRWGARAVGLLGPLLRAPAGQAAVAGALAGVLGVHSLAAARARRAAPGGSSLLLAAITWTVPLSAATVFALLYASRLFVPGPEPGLSGPLGRFVGAHFTARLVLWVVLVALLVRLWIAVASAARAGRQGAKAPLGPGGTPSSAAQTAAARPGGSMGFLLRTGAALSAAGLGLALLLHLTPRWEAALFELSALARDWAQAGLAFGLALGRRAAQSPVHAAAAAMVAILLACIHEEGRKGRTQLHGLLGAAWVMLLVPLIGACVAEAAGTLHPAAPGRAAALTVATALLAVLLMAALALIASWWRWRRRHGDQEELVPGAAAWAAHSLGSVGLVMCLAASAVVLHGALAGNAGYWRAFQRVAEGASAFVNMTAAGVDAFRADLERRGKSGSVAAALAGVSSLVLVLHFLARYGGVWARSAVYALWLAVALVGIAMLTYVLHRHPFGTWTAGQILGALAGAALVVRILGVLLSTNPETA